MSEARTFTFPTRGGGGSSVVPWMAARDADVTAVSFPDRNAPKKAEAQKPVAAPPPQERRSIPPPAALPTPPPGSSSLFPRGPELAMELEGKIAAFAQAIGELALAKHKTLVSVEGELLELSIAIASAIVERELDADTHRVLVRAALGELGGKPTEVKVRASREAHTALADEHGHASIELEGHTIPISLDPSLSGLGCIVENGDGRVDGRVESRLESARTAMREAMQARRLSEEG
jgi:hypothetical protein